ncbi:intermembrane phospholipid transport protein YdbH family protein [Agarivorans sp. Z349TD_8]|uniref:intermembrane phospholipid transport protein YdbH family protein n=1 Tax=Agarivorans sp. Z349TD_8 TaxID=3421434 RepID=UPI003D7DDFD9
MASFICLLVGKLYATELSADMLQAQFGGCPQVRTSGLRLQAIPLRVKVESIEIDLACLLAQGQHAQPFRLVSLKPLAQQLFQGLLDLPSSVVASSVAVDRLQVKAGAQSLFDGQLQLSQRGQQWLASYQQEDGLAIKLQLLPKAETLILEGHLGKHSLRALAGLIQQPQLDGPIFADADFSLRGKAGQHLQLNAQFKLPTLAMEGKAWLQGWQDWRLRLESSSFHWQGKDWPSVESKIQAKGWQVEVADWQLKGEGLWQWTPAMQLSGLLHSDNVLPLQQALLPLAEPAKLLSGALESHFTWQAEQLTSQFKLSGLNALWGELALADAQLAGQLDYQPDLGWKHAGELQVKQWDIGFPVSDIQLHWQQPNYAPLEQWHSLLLDDISFGSLGGRGRLAQLRLKLPSQTSLQLSKVQLSQLATLYPELALSMQGSVSGTLPLQLSRQGLAIKGGSLAVVEPHGHIALTHQSLLAVKAQHPSLDFALSLLEDFDYEKLAAELDFAEDGLLDMQVQLIGRNQQLSPRLVTLNYRHQENIYQLLRSLRIGQQLSGQLQQWIDDSASEVSPLP